MGAPNGTFPGGLTFTGVDDSEALNHTGLVYVCPISPPGDCEALTGNGTGVDIRLFDYEGWSLSLSHSRCTFLHYVRQCLVRFNCYLVPPPSPPLPLLSHPAGNGVDSRNNDIKAESKEGQFLGATIISSGDHLMVSPVQN